MMDVRKLSVGLVVLLVSLFGGMQVAVAEPGAGMTIDQKSKSVDKDIQRIKRTLKFTLQRLEKLRFTGQPSLLSQSVNSV